MTREEALNSLEECKRNPDYEEAHADADDVLCELLSSLGYEDVVDAWEDVPRWYV